MKQPMLVHVAVIEGTEDSVKTLTKALKPLKDKYNIDFLVTNDKIQLRDVKTLIEELYILYKRYKQSADKAVKAVKGVNNDKA